MQISIFPNNSVQSAIANSAVMGIAYSALGFFVARIHKLPPTYTLTLGIQGVVSSLFQSAFEAIGAREGIARYKITLINACVQTVCALASLSAFAAMGIFPPSQIDMAVALTPLVFLTGALKAALEYQLDAT